MPVTTDAESIEGVGNCKDTVHTRVEANVVVMHAATAAGAGDRCLICELRG